MIQRSSEDVRNKFPDVFHNAEKMVITTSTDPIVSPFYLGVAPPGTKKSDAKWRIYRITTNEDGGEDTHFAGGNTNFNYVWNDRETYQYS